MHGTFNNIGTVPAISDSFIDFIHSLYDDKIIPQIRVVDDVTDVNKFLAQTGCVAVLGEDESYDCPAFDDWGDYYAFMGWLSYRAVANDGNEFSLMVKDVLDHRAWSHETNTWISVLSALVVVQEEYAETFGHYPADLDKFIKAYITHDSDFVLSADVF
jgi:hypothetical protein